MSMKTEIHEKDGVTIVRARGKITIGEGDIKLRETIEGLLAAGKNNVLLDLGGVSFMDSSGVGELVGCYTTVMNRGGKLKLLNLTKKINDLLAVTQLITVFECYQDESEALQSYRRS
jgi:anti-sigma B factor antagonist